MQEFAQQNSAPPAGPCPSTEDLAAYIDGALGEAESRRITEHLATCEDCYAVYTETLRFQLDTESVFLEGEVLPFPASQEKRTAGAVIRQWLPIAALLLVGVGTGTYFRFLAPPPGLVTTRLTPSPPGAEQLWLGPTYRGEGGGEEAKLDEAAFRMGVQLVNLQTTLKAGNVPAAQDVIARILGLLRAQPFTDDLQKGYTGVTVALTKYLEPQVSDEGLSEAARLARESQEDPTVASMVIPEVSRLAKESRDAFDGDALDLGQWVEAAHLASQAQNPSFFQQADTRNFLRHLRWRDKLGLGDTRLDPVSRESLERISEIVSRGDLRASDYADLDQQLKKILDHHYPET